MASPRKEGLLAFSFHLVVAAVMTWPLLGRLGTHVPMGTNDLWQNYWNLWWWKQALLQGRSPYFTELLFHPEGAPLGLHTHSPATMLLTLPVNLLFGEAVALNLAIFFGFALAGFGGFLLAREYTHRWPAALLAGIVASYFPQHVEQSLEHVNLASYWAMPLFLWALVKTIRYGGRWWLLTGFFFALNCLFAWHNGLMSIPLGLAVALFELWRGSRPWKRATLDLTRSALVAAVILAPFAWPLVRDTSADVARVQRCFPDRSIDPISLLVPHSGHPLWGSALTELQIKIRRYRAVGGLGYIGWAALTLLVASGILAWRRPSSVQPTTGTDPPAGAWTLWLGLCLFFLVLSFGSSIHSRLYETPDWLLLPFHWLKTLPLFGLVRLPNRFFVPALLSFTVTLAIGVDAVLRPLPARRGNLIAGALALLLLLDYAWLPYPTRELPRPAWVSAITKVPPDLTVLDITTSHRGPGGIDMYHQTLHQRPIVGGYISANLRSTARRFRRFPQLRRVFKPLDEKDLTSARPTLAESIRQLDTGIVVVHLERTRGDEAQAKKSESREAPNFTYRIRLFDPNREMAVPRLQQIRRELQIAFGQPFYADDEVEIYRVR